MRKLTALMLVSTFAIVLASLASFAGDDKKPDQKKDAKKLVCPVAGDPIEDPQTAARGVHSGQVYLFCCPACKPAFDGDPEKYTKVAVKKDAKVTCPVARETVKDPTTAPLSVHENKVYVFCCASCKGKFDKEPTKFVKAEKKEVKK